MRPALRAQSEDPVRDLDYHFADKGLHAAVLISHPDYCAKSNWINVLFCTSQRQSRAPYPYEIMLNTEDGFNWETFCDCSIMWVVDSSKLIRQRGHVVLERRRAIRAKLRDLFLLQATD